MTPLTKTEKEVIKEFNAIYGTAKKPNKEFILVEVKKNTFVPRTMESIHIPFHMIIRTGWAKIKINPDKFPNLPLHQLQCLVKVIEKRFPELKNKFSHKPPQVEIMNQRDKDLRDYSFIKRKN